MGTAATGCGLLVMRIGRSDAHQLAMCTPRFTAGANCRSREVSGRSVMDETGFVTSGDDFAAATQLPANAQGPNIDVATGQ